MLISVLLVNKAISRSFHSTRSQATIPRLLREIYILARWNENAILPDYFFFVTLKTFRPRSRVAKGKRGTPVRLPLRQANFSGYVRARTSAGKLGKPSREKLFTLLPWASHSTKRLHSAIRTPTLVCVGSLKRMSLCDVLCSFFLLLVFISFFTNVLTY